MIAKEATLGVSMIVTITMIDTTKAALDMTMNVTATERVEVKEIEIVIGTIRVTWEERMTVYQVLMITGLIDGDATARFLQTDLKEHDGMITETLNLRDREILILNPSREKQRTKK